MFTLIDPNNQPTGLPAGSIPEDDGNDWYPMIMPPPRESENQEMIWEIIDGTCVGRWAGNPDPMSRAATALEISQMLREFEIAPILVFDELYDCDERSEVRMRDAHTYWDSRALEPGVFEERLIEGVLTKVILWVKADNETIELTNTELYSVYSEMLSQRAARATVLFASARRFKNDPGTTIGHIKSISNWLSS